MSFALGMNPLLVDTDAQGPIGTRITDNDGKEFVYGVANGAITANDVVLLDEVYSTDQVDTTNTATAFGQICGVALATYADGEFGWFQIWGVNAAINVGSSCAANTALNSTGTAGRIDDDATTGAEVIDGIVLTTAEASGNTAPGVLFYPTVGATLP